MINNNTTTFLADVYPMHVAYLQKLTKSEKIHHGYCIIGESNGAQDSAAQFWIEEILKHDSTQVQQFRNGTHPDIALISSIDHKRIGVDQAAQVRAHLSSRPAIAPKRIVHISDAHLLTTQAANALLKVIEEPGPDALILLTTSTPDALPQTILSRTQQIYFPLLSHEATEQIVEQQALTNVEQEQIIHAAEGRYGRLLELIQTPEERKRQIGITSFWIQFLLSSIGTRDQIVSTHFLKAKNSKEALHALPQILETIERIVHDLFLRKIGVNGRTTIVHQEQNMQLLDERYSIEELQQKLNKIQELQELCAHQVNKKMIFEYLVTQL